MQRVIFLYLPTSIRRLDNVVGDVHDIQDVLDPTSELFTIMIFTQNMILHKDDFSVRATIILLIF